MIRPAIVLLYCLMTAAPVAAEEAFVPIDSAPVHKFTISNYGKHYAGISAASPGGTNWHDVNAIPPMQFESWNFAYCRIDYLITWDDDTSQEFHQDTCANPNLELRH